MAAARPANGKHATQQLVGAVDIDSALVNRIPEEICEQADRLSDLLSTIQHLRRCRRPAARGNRRMPEEILRTFIAIELDEPLLVAIGRVQGKFKRQVPDLSVRWVAPNAMHFTLKFLGETSSRRVPEVTAAIREACAGFAPFDISIEGRGCFPNCRRPRVIWVAVRDHGHSLAGLQAAVERHVSPLGWPTEERPFSPHLTLGRIGRNVRPAEEAAVGQIVEKSVVELIGTQRVAELHYIKSDLRPAGPIYTTLAVVPLGPDPRALVKLK